MKLKVHSGESDFDPPRFKPNPSVYLKAAKTEGKEPVNCIAVEDSGSGVGSASNAGVGEVYAPLVMRRCRQIGYSCTRIFAFFLVYVLVFVCVFSNKPTF